MSWFLWFYDSDLNHKRKIPITCILYPSHVETQHSRTMIRDHIDWQFSVVTFNHDGFVVTQSFHLPCYSLSMRLRLNTRCATRHNLSLNRNWREHKGSEASSQGTRSIFIVDFSMSKEHRIAALMITRFVYAT